MNAKIDIERTNEPAYEMVFRVFLRLETNQYQCMD